MQILGWTIRGSPLPWVRLTRYYARPTTGAMDEDFNFASPRPAEVLYQHIRGIENRLALFQQYKMRKQLDIDLDQLKALRMSYQRPVTHTAMYSQKLLFRNGLRDLTFPESNKVRLELSLSSLTGLTHSEKHKFKLLCGTRYNALTDKVTLVSRSLPFPEMNKRRLKEILEALIKEAKVDPDRYAALSIAKSKRKRRILLLPVQWFPRSTTPQAHSKVPNEPLSTTASTSS